MDHFLFHNTNNPAHRVPFKEALLAGQAPEYGLYTPARKDIPLLESGLIREMKGMPYAEIAYHVLHPFLNQIPPSKIRELLDDAYRPDVIDTKVQHVKGKTNIMWLTGPPTHSFKDYASRFYARTTNHFLVEERLWRLVLNATSGDTGGAISDALYGLENVAVFVVYPQGKVSEGQRRQMTTLRGNIYAVELNADFNVCQDLTKVLLNDKEFFHKVFGDINAATSANSISVGRLLPQMVYPFYAHSRIADGIEPMIVSIPSGNFGDMMGTLLAMQRGLPVSRIVCGVNENKGFVDFLERGVYGVGSTKLSPSSAMNVPHPSNLARVFDHYGGHMHDERDRQGKVIREGVITRMPDLFAMRKDIFSVSIGNEAHFDTMQRVHKDHGIILDPHGAVGWRALELLPGFNHDQLAAVYETADPGKFPDEVHRAIGITPPLPVAMERQRALEERIYQIRSEPDRIGDGKTRLSAAQIAEAKALIQDTFSARQA